MRIWIVFFVISLLSCKKEDRVPLAQKMPDGVLGFTVENVPRENIRFLAFGSENPNRIVVNLPADYPVNNKITCKVTLPQGYVLKNFFQETLNNDHLEVDYEGAYPWLFIRNGERTIGELYIYVNPSAPIIVPAAGKKYEVVLDGNNPSVYPSVLNWGTAETVSSTEDSLIFSSPVLIKNKKTGATTTSASGFDRTIDGSPFYISIPSHLEAGEYELTLRRDNRSAVVPDAVVLKYGPPVVSFGNFNQASYQDSSYKVSLKGYNFLGNHSFEMVLKNDLSGVNRFKLTPKDHLTLTTNLPATMLPGSYETDVFVNGAKIPNEHLITEHNLLFLYKANNYPAIGFLSQKQHRYNNQTGLTLFKPVTTFHRQNEIIALITTGKDMDASIKKSALLLENTVSKQVYELSQADSLAASMFPQYSIPSIVPAGKYWVRSKIPPMPALLTGGVYYRMITIE